MGDGFAWRPQAGPQLLAIEADWCTELFYGGARGGGKTDLLLGDFLQGVPEYGSAWRGIVFRQSMPELDDIIARSHEIYPQTGAEWGEQKKTWRWPNGAFLRLRQLEKTRDAGKYQGHAYSWIGWDELQRWPTLEAYHFLKACLRSPHDVPKKRIRSTGNPGGVGHHAIKEYFIDPAPLGFEPLDDPVSGHSKLFIPAKVEDNLILLAKDPGYVARLRSVGSPQLVKAWLEGDWSVITGAYYPEFSTERHVCAPCQLPKEWLRFAAIDWGSYRPFAVIWFAVSDGTWGPWPANTLIAYREWYGGETANIGLKLPADVVAKQVKERTLEDIAYLVADPSMFKEDGGPSIGERFRQAGLPIRPADNSRLAGWDAVRQRLRGDDRGARIVFFSTCSHAIRTVPALQHDESRPEDVNTEGDDHMPDAVRYGCMSRPWVQKIPQPEPLRTVQEMTMDEAWALHEASKPRRNRV